MSCSREIKASTAGPVEIGPARLKHALLYLQVLIAAPLAVGVTHAMNPALT